MSSCCDRHLPEELLIDVLSRLPVRSLIRFKSVSKYWYHLIKSPSFIHKHYHKPHNRTHLITNFTTDTIADGVAISVLFPDDTPIQHGYVDTNYITPIQTLLIQQGPINGIFLVGYNDTRQEHLALWNPASKEFKILPPLPDKKMLMFCSPPHFGFCLHPLTNVYTVVSILNYSGLASVVGLYSLDTDSWTQKQIHPVWSDKVRSIWYRSSIFLDGICYWQSGELEFSLLSFDIATEEFQEIQGPLNASFPDNISCYNDDSIAIFVYPSDHSLHMWLMDPKERTWINKFNIGLIGIDVSHGFWKEDLMIVTTVSDDNRMQLAVYNIQNNEIKNLGLYGHHFNVFFNYKESLYSFQQ